MTEPLRVAVCRGHIIESIHEVHAVAVKDGAVVAEAGDTTLLTSLRSSAKPFQALPLVRSLPMLEDCELAIACASHRAEPEQIEAVWRLLEKTGGTPGELECGAQDGRPPEPLYHNCSGKHAGMLAVCRAEGWPTEGYRLPEHPLQQLLMRVMADAAQIEGGELATATDGCGVVCYAVPLERVALAFSRLGQLDGGARIVAAMRAHPELIGGEHSTDTLMMEALGGWIAKGGAEGLMCAAGDGIGVAVKIADGNSRALRPALAKFMGSLGLELSTFEDVPIRNSREEVVGEIAPT
jgi:L-asparaginase II